MMRGRRIQRIWIRLGFLSAAAAMLWPVPFTRFMAEVPAQASPFVTACVLLAEKTFQGGMVLGILTAAAAFARRRWFCRYACPTGLLLEGAIHVGMRKSTLWRRFPPVGRYTLFITLAGAAVGYPLFLWTDPLAVFSSALSVRNSVSVIAGVSAVGCLLVLLATAFVFGDLWCARLCPLGALQDLIATATGSLPGLWKRNAKSPSDGGKDVPIPAAPTRRAFLSVAAGVGLGLLAEGAGGARGANAPLRPPGAVGEDTFAGLCARCGNCIRSCPSRIIHADGGRAGFAGLLAPVVRFKTEYCLEDCNVCTQVCPSGALKELSLEQKNRFVIGEALVDGALCYMIQGISDCDICVRSCPFHAVEVYWDEELYVAYPNIDPDKCNGCGACEVYCPTHRVKAIRVWKTDGSPEI